MSHVQNIHIRAYIISKTKPWLSLKWDAKRSCMQNHMNTVISYSSCWEIKKEMVYIILPTLVPAMRHFSSTAAI